MKELYAKVLPPIASFQRMVTGFEADNYQFKEMIFGFDKHLSLKANKNMVEILEKECQ